MSDNVEQKSKKKGAIVAIAALVLIVAVAVLAYSAMPGIRAGMPYELTAADSIDQAASSRLMGSVVENANGEKLSFGELQKETGKPIVMNLWATWCPHCEEEMSSFQTLYEEYGDRVEFVMLDLAESKDESQAARAYAKEAGYTFPLYFDSDAQVRTALGVMGIPVTAMVNADGGLVLVRSGSINYNAMKGTLENLLKA